MDLYGLKNCDSCRKAKKTLEAAGCEVVFHDLRDEAASKDQIASWMKAVGWERLLNTRSTTWRGLSDDEKANVDEAKALSLMMEHPTLMKRPIIENGSTQVFVGWSKDVETALTT